MSRPVVLITGGVRRVGRAIAGTFADAGWDLVLTYNSSGHEAKTAVAELGEQGAAVRTDQLDLDDLSAVESYAQRLAGELERLDALVHNASAYFPTPIDALTADDAVRMHRVNAIAPLMLTHGLSPLLRESPRGGGSVVAMCDAHSMGRPRAGFSAYSMSKAALAEMVRSLARELAPDVRVNGVAPGVVLWPETGEESDESAQRRYLERIPLGRPGTPEEAAELVRWLTIDATYLTGEIIRLDGGRHLA